MDAEKFRYVEIAAAVVTVVGGAYFAYKKGWFSIIAPAPQQTSDTIIANAPQMPAAYNPQQMTFAPIPVGVNHPGAPGSTAPGVDPAAVTLPSVQPVPLAPHAPLPPPSIPNVDTNPIVQAHDPALTGNSALIDADYMRLFGRHAEQAGLDYWNNALAHGGDTSNLVASLTRGAQGADLTAEIARQPQYVTAFRGVV
jgi:hypothetical protein